MSDPVGKLGGWRNYLTDEMLETMKAWTEKSLKDEPELLDKLWH